MVQMRLTSDYDDDINSIPCLMDRSISIACNVLWSSAGLTNITL